MKSGATSGGAASGTAARRIRILLCDDHDGVRGALRLLIQAEPDLEVVGEAADGASLLRLAAERAADVILMDISLPDLSGFAVTAALRRSGTTAKVLALSAHEDQAYVEQMRAAGAAGYVVKRKVGDSLVRIIRDVADSQREPASVASEASQAPAPLPQAPSGLAAEILNGLAAGQSRKQLAAELGLEPAELAERQQETLERLGLRTRADVVRFARGCGWLPGRGR
ncbi:MAG: response regulator transcription factor [Polyangia bacterium]